MRGNEKKMASFIKDHWEEMEDCLGIEFYRVYCDTTFNGAVKDCTFSDCTMPDVLCIEYVKNDENGREYVQLFASTPDDDGQEWFTFSGLSKRDKQNVVKLFDAMVAKGGFPDRTKETEK